MDDREKELRSLLDTTAIRALVDDYAEAADRGRSAELAALFAPDGVLEISGESFDAGLYTGREEILTRLEQTRGLIPPGAEAPLIRHHLSTVRVRQSAPDKARVDSYFLAVTATGPDHWGRYSDRVIATATNGWCFAHRRVIHEGHAADSWLARGLATARGEAD
jgi:hypothetical protein